MPTFSDLCRAFASPETLPVEVTSIARWIMTNGFTSAVSFYPVDIDEQYLYGFMEQYEADSPRPYVETEHYTKVYYSQHANECWQRFICCKELTHTLDLPQNRTNTKSDIEALINQLTNLGAQEPGAQTLADVNGAARALVLLAPLGVINLLRDAYKTKVKSRYEIALFLKIPEVFIDYLFSDNYSELYNSHLD